MLLEELLNIIDLTGLTRELMAVLAKYNLPFPDIKISNTSRNSLGRCVLRTKSYIADGKVLVNFPPTSEIQIEKKVTGDREGAKRVLAHELCHHTVNFAYEKPYIEKYGVQAYTRLAKSDHTHGHGPWFLEVASLFNDKYGENYVTPTSDGNFVIDTSVVKMFYILVVKFPDGLRWQNSYKLTHQMGNFLRMFPLYLEPKLFRINNNLFKGNSSIGNSFWNKFKDDQYYKDLNTLYNEGQDILNQTLHTLDERQVKKSADFLKSMKNEG